MLKLVCRSDKAFAPPSDKMNAQKTSKLNMSHVARCLLFRH
ncbi:hypothetical protein A464_4198 [Salmonella bongori N268-08]|uniref:Uncharacterized protein n=1 Tax=Salmonella bongori N268-08 TaxID=1197719 RepID=S5MXI8_SALBN|nr:hypothetical protein A464_4198 [Salmonella bongori N268-08]